MTRRSLFSLLFVAPAAAQFQSNDDLQRDFYQLINNFVRSWNRVTDQVMDGKWDYKVAGECVKAFDKLTEHPMWLKVKGK